MVSRWSGRHVAAAFGVGVILSGVTVARASTLGTLNTGNIGTSSTVVAACDTDGINASWDNGGTSPVYSGNATVANSTFNVVTIKLNNVNNACNGQFYKVVLANGVGTALVTASGTASVVSNTITITVAAQDSKLVGQVVVTLYQ